MKRWYKSYKNAVKDAEKNECDIISTGNNWTDIYYLIPKNCGPGIVRTIARSQGECSGKKYIYRVIYKQTNGEIFCVDKATKHRINTVKSGRIPEEKIESYLNGYYTLKEETSEKIKQRKENARISHFLCDAGGKAGHEERQNIRKKLRKGYK